MKVLQVTGNQKLTGSIRISGAKNSAVALIPATLLSTGTTTICNIPDILDIDVLEKTLEYLNVDVKRASGSILIDTTNFQKNYQINFGLLIILWQFFWLDLNMLKCIFQVAVKLVQDLSTKL